MPEVEAPSHKIEEPVLALGSAEIRASVLEIPIEKTFYATPVVSIETKQELEEIKKTLKAQQLWIDKTEDFLFRLANYRSNDHKIP